MYLRDPLHWSFPWSETAISADTAATLHPLWTARLKAPIASGVTVSDGVLYFGDWAGQFYAVEAATGNILWQQYAGMAPAPSDPACQAPIGITSQPTVLGNDVIVGGGDSAVYAFDRASGDLHWRTPLADPASGSYIWSSIVPYNGALYVGVASLGDCPLVRGLLARIDPADPANPLIRYLYPPDDEDNGGGIWSTPAIDAATNTVYVTTGTGEEDAAAGKWGSAFASFDADTLEMKAYYFLPGGDSGEDIEWGSSPTVYSANGVRMVAATGKDGVLYALTAEDMTPAWSIPISVGCACPECGCGSLSTPAFDGQTLYVGAGVRDPDLFANGSIWAIDAASGAPLWYQDLDQPVIAPVTVANGVVYAATLSGLRLFDAATGTLLWDDGAYGIMFGQPVLANGALYAPYINGDLVAWVAGPAGDGAAPSAVPRRKTVPAQIPYVFCRAAQARKQAGPVNRAQFIELMKRERAAARRNVPAGSQ